MFEALQWADKTLASNLSSTNGSAIESPNCLVPPAGLVNYFTGEFCLPSERAAAKVLRLKEPPATAPRGEERSQTDSAKLRATKQLLSVLYIKASD